MQPQEQESLSPEKLQLFVATLSGLSPEEVRKAYLDAMGIQLEKAGSA